VEERIDFWFERFGTKVPPSRANIEMLRRSVKAKNSPGIYFDIKTFYFFAGKTCRLTILGEIRIDRDAALGRRDIQVEIAGIDAVKSGLGAQVVFPYHQRFDGTNFLIRTIEVVP
jgi:hypothetical protein